MPAEVDLAAEKTPESLLIRPDPTFSGVPNDGPDELEHNPVHLAPLPLGKFPTVDDAPPPDVNILRRLLTKSPRDVVETGGRSEPGLRLPSSQSISTSISTLLLFPGVDVGEETSSWLLLPPPVDKELVSMNEDEETPELELVETTWCVWREKDDVVTVVSLDVTTVLMLRFSPILDVVEEVLPWSKLSFANAVVGERSEEQQGEGAPRDDPGAVLKLKLKERGILDDRPGLTDPEPFLSPPKPASRNEEGDARRPHLPGWFSASNCPWLWQVWKNRGAFRSANEAGADRIEAVGEEPVADARLAWRIFSNSSNWPRKLKLGDIDALCDLTYLKR